MKSNELTTSGGDIALKSAGGVTSDLMKAGSEVADSRAAIGEVADARDWSAQQRAQHGDEGNIRQTSASEFSWPYNFFWLSISFLLFWAIVW